MALAPPLFAPPPRSAAWRHGDARPGFEAAFFHALGSGWRIEGSTVALAGGEPWVVTYSIEVDSGWVTRRARILSWSASGSRSVALDADGAGHWLVDGAAAAHLDGCLDIDLEASALTNTLPVHRLEIPVGGRAAPAAAFVRTHGPRVELLEQAYERLADEGTHRHYAYAAPAFGFTTRLRVDQSGLIVEYPGIATRVG